MEFAKALKSPMTRHDGYQESSDAVVTWCVGHLVSMSYPDKYDPALKRWRLETLPFLPDQFLYEVIPAVKKQFQIVSGLLNRKDVDTIYVCTDSGREGEYIYRLVAAMAGVKGKVQKRVWIDSQTEEEILRGIREAKDLSAYDNLSASAYLRAKEDYLMGINFSRLLTLRYGDALSDCLGESRCVISVGRVMTCVLGMIVRREREIRSFEKTPFYRVIASLTPDRQDPSLTLDAEWRAAEGSRYFGSPVLYKENGFRLREDAQSFVDALQEGEGPWEMTVAKAEKKKEKKYPPLLYNLAELQNDASRMFHISPDQTLNIAQELYEKKLITYPRTDARVLSSAVAKEIDRNLKGLLRHPAAGPVAKQILDEGMYHGIGKTRYTNDKQITDHYALIPTGAGLGALSSLSKTAYGVYMTIVRRFLRIFYPPAQYRKISLTAVMQGESFFASLKILEEPGYLSVMPDREKGGRKEEGESADPRSGPDLNDPETARLMLEKLSTLRSGSRILCSGFSIREGETSPPKHYNSGTMVLAMENAGQLIEDEELRAQIRGSGIGTSATRAEILKKLVTNKYIALNKKTQILTPTLMGELIYDVVDSSIRPLLNPDLTASWEKGLTYVAEGTLTSDEYMVKLRDFIIRRTDYVLRLRNQGSLSSRAAALKPFYSTGKGKQSRKTDSDLKE